MKLLYPKISITQAYLRAGIGTYTYWPHKIEYPFKCIVSKTIVNFNRELLCHKLIQMECYDEHLSASFSTNQHGEHS